MGQKFYVLNLVNLNRRSSFCKFAPFFFLLTFLLIFKSQIFLLIFLLIFE